MQQVLIQRVFKQTIKKLLIFYLNKQMFIMNVVPFNVNS